MKGKALQVLLVEDGAGDARLLREMFRTETPGSFVLTHVERMSDALSHLAKAPGVDILLIDMGLLDGRGLDTVQRAHAAAPGAPLIVLEVARFQSGKLTIDLERVSVSDAIADTVNTLPRAAAAKEIALSYDVPLPSPLACADPTRLRQILIILVDNAIKFTPTHGTVKVQARILEKDPTFLVLEVLDSGCGISPDMTERILGRQCQVSNPALAGRKGLGLGLYICRELVTRQGGEISVNSQLGRGAMFAFSLPAFSLASLLSPALANATLREKSPDPRYNGAWYTERRPYQGGGRQTPTTSPPPSQAMPAFRIGRALAQDKLRRPVGTLLHRGCYGWNRQSGDCQAASGTMGAPWASSESR